MKVVNIYGTSFSGSTITSYLLGSHRVVANVGESHWLTNDIEGFDDGCYSCVGDCRVLNRHRYLSVSGSHHERLFRLSRRPLLVDTTKDQHLHQSLGKFENECSVILFKDPVKNFESYLRVAGNLRGAYTKEQYLLYWTEFYSKLCMDLERPLFVSFEKIQMNLVTQISRLYRAFDLDFDMKYLRYWRFEQHPVGGNFSLLKRARDFPRGLSFDPKISERDGAVKLERDEETDEHLLAQALFRKMTKMSQ